MGDVVPATWGFTNYQFDESENALFNSDARYDAQKERTRLVVGGTTERRHRPERVRFE